MPNIDHNAATLAPLLVWCVPERIIDGSVMGHVVAATPDGFGRLTREELDDLDEETLSFDHLSEDAEEWERFADRDLADAGYRRLTPWREYAAPFVWTGAEIERI